MTANAESEFSRGKEAPRKTSQRISKYTELADEDGVLKDYFENK